MITLRELNRRSDLPAALASQRCPPGECPHGPPRHLWQFRMVWIGGGPDRRRVSVGVCARCGEFMHDIPSDQLLERCGRSGGD